MGGLRQRIKKVANELAPCAMIEIWCVGSEEEKS